jgi:autotransporter-associated beta strand protein
MKTNVSRKLVKSAIRQNTMKSKTCQVHRFAMLFLFCGLLAAAALTAKAGNGVDTWSSSGTTANWGGTGASGNWTGANTPPITGDSLVFDIDNSAGGGLGDVLTDNLTVGGSTLWTFANITFTANAPAYTIAPGTAAGQGPGAGFTLGTATPATVINQNSGSSIIIKDPLTLGATNQTIALTGGGNLTFSGLISGTGGITVTGTGTLILTNGAANAVAAENYTGATVVNGATLTLFGPNATTSGIYKSSSLTITNGGTVIVGIDNALAGSAGTLGTLPITNYTGGTLTSLSTADAGAGGSTHIRGLLTLNGGTLATGGTGNQPAFGSWDLDDGVVVGAGTAANSVISAIDVIPDQAGGTIFNVGVSGASPDLDVQGTLIHGTSQADTGIIKQGAGTMQLDGINTYTGPTTISAGTLTINSSSLLGGATGTYAGLITNNGTLNYNNSAVQTLSGAITGSGVINVNAGTLTLGGANTYSGATTVASGANLTVVSGGVSKSPITMSAGTTFTENVVTVGGQWSLTNNLTFVDSSPVMVMNFSNSLSTTVAPLSITGNINFASTLTLTLNGNALIPTGTYPLITWTGTASGTAPTTANGNVTINLTGVTATLVQSGSTINLVVSSGTGPVSWNTGSGTWDTASANWLGASTYKDGDSVTFPDTTGSSPITVTLNSTVTPSSVVFTNNTKNYVLSGTGGISGATGLAEQGPGSLTMSTANTYTGPTVVNNGTLTLDFTPAAAPAGGIISSSSALTLGNATLKIVGSASTPSSQTFASTAFTAGNGVITFGNNNPTLNLGGAISVTKGATVVIPATGGTISTSGAGAAAGNVLGTAVGANDTAGFATFGLSDWASSAGGTIQGLSSGAGYATAMGGTGQGQNMDLQATYTAGGNVGTTTLRYNTPGVDTVNINGKWIVVNAILVTPNMGAENTFIWSGNGVAGGGMYFADYSTGNAQQLYLWQNNTNAYFYDNGALANGRNNSGAPLAYIQAGLGTVIRSPSLYTGLSYLNGGFTVITNDSCLGVSATAATVVMSSGTIVGNSTMTLDNGGLNPRPIQLLNQGGGLAATANTTLTVDGIISGGTGPLIIGIPASGANGNVAGLLPGSGANTANTTPVYATGIVSLTAANTYTGGTVLDTGVLSIGSGSLGTGGVTFNGGTLQWNSTGPDISTQKVTINSGGGTLDVNGKTITLANSIGNGGSGALTVINSGAPGVGGLFLNGGVSYTGGTIVSSGAVLGGTGTIAGNVTWSSGSFATLSSSSLLTVSGTVTLNNPTVNVIASGLTTGVYTLLTATGGITGGSTVNSTPGGTGVFATGYAGTVSISGNSIILKVTQSGVTETWTDVNSDQNWSETNNWSGSFVPHRPGDIATFGIGGIGLPVNLDQNETVGGIAFTNASSYTVTGTNTLTLDASGHGAAIGVTAGTANAINTSVKLNDNVTASINSGDSLTLGGVIANQSTPETLTVNGGGTIIITNANTYGPAAGTVGTILGGATVQVNKSTSLGAGDVNVTSSSTLQAGAAGVNLANKIIVANANTVSVAGGGNNLTLSGVISGNGSLTGTGNGTVTLSGVNNTYAGGTVLNSGVLGIVADGAAAGNSGSLGLVPASIAPNNILLNGGVLLGGSTLALNPNRGLGIGSASIANNAITTGFIDAAGGQTFTINGVIGTAGNLGTNNLTVNSQPGSTGTVILAAANTFNGTNIIAGGTEQLGNSQALQNSTLLYNNQGGSLSFGTLTGATLNGLIGSQNLALINSTNAPVTLTIGVNNAGGIFSGNISGPGSLIHQGSGTEVLLNATYTGATVVEAGNIVFNNPNLTGGSLDLSGVVQYNYPASVVINGGALTSTNGTYITSDTGYTATSGVYNNLCTLIITNNANFTSGADAGGRAISFGRGNCRPGIGQMLQVGSGLGDSTVVTANGALDMFYSSGGGTVGNCTVNLNGGALVANSIQQTTSGGNQTAFINFNGGVLTAGTNDPAGGDFIPALNYLTMNVTNASIPAFISSSNFTVTIATPLKGGGDAGLVKQGSGTLILAGANTYSGLTTVSNGTLLVSGSLNNASENFAVNDGKAFGAYYNGSTTPEVGSITLGQSSGSTLVFTNLSSTGAAAFHADYLYLNGRCNVNVKDAANLSAGNEYPLIQISGSIVTNGGNGFTLSLPPGVSGTLTNDSSILSGYSTLALVVTSIVPYTPPVVFSTPVVSGNSFVLSATGGNPGDPVTLLSSTNVALPLAQWITVTSGNYDGSGHFSYTNTGVLNSGLRQQFYILQGQ